MSFGKFELSSNAFKLALQLTSEVECSIHQLFIVVSDCAYAQAKLMRQTSLAVLTEDEKSLWRRAFRILDGNETLHVNKALFLYKYAFALTDVDEKKKLVKEIFDIIQANEKSMSSMLILKCTRLAKRTKQTDIRDALIHKLWKRPENLEHGDFFYEMSKVFSFKDPDENAKAVEILKNGKKAALIGKKHVFLDLDIVNRQWKMKGEDWANREYKTLFVKYWDPRSQSIIRNFRASHLFHQLVLNYESTDSEDIITSLNKIFDDLITAFNLCPDVFCFPKLPNKIVNFLEESKHTPEYLGWFLENIRGNTAFVGPTRVQKLYKSVIEDPDAATERKDFARLHLGRCYLRKGNFIDAKELFKQLPATCLEKNYLLSESVYSDKNSSEEDLKLCMELGNCDVIEMIFDQLEESKSKQLSETDRFSERNFCAQKEMFCSTSSYEFCSSVLDLLDSEEAFRINPETLDQDFVTNVKTRVENFLGISYDKDLWRLYRLNAVKLNQSGEDVRQHEMNREILGVLSEARKELDRCVKKLGPKKKKFFYPRVVKGDFLETEGQLKEILGMSVGEVERRIKSELKECRIGSSFDDVINFLVNRDHYIITQEGAWQVLWMNAINEDKHENQLDLEKFEKRVLDLQKKAGVDPDINTVLDVTHKVAEYVEQTLLVFERVQLSTSTQR